MRHAGDGVHEEVLLQADALVRRLLDQGAQRRRAEKRREEHEERRGERLRRDSLCDVLHVVREAPPVVVDNAAEEPALHEGLIALDLLAAAAHAAEPLVRVILVPPGERATTARAGQTNWRACVRVKAVNRRAPLLGGGAVDGLLEVGARHGDVRRRGAVRDLQRAVDGLGWASGERPGHSPSKVSGASESLALDRIYVDLRIYAHTTMAKAARPA